MLPARGGRVVQEPDVTYRSNEEALRARIEELEAERDASWSRPLPEPLDPIQGPSAGTIIIAWMICLLGIVALVTFSHGCGASPQQTARRTNHALAIAVDATDAAFAPVYASRARAALDAATSLEEYRLSMHDLDAVTVALETASASIQYAERLVDLWDQGGARSWPQAISCVAGALIGLEDVMTAAQVPLPPELVDAIAFGREAGIGDHCLDPEHHSEEP